MSEKTLQELIQNREALAREMERIANDEAVREAAYQADRAMQQEVAKDLLDPIG